MLPRESTPDVVRSINRIRDTTTGDTGYTGGQRCWTSPSGFSRRYGGDGVEREPETWEPVAAGTTEPFTV